MAKGKDGEKALKESKKLTKSELKKILKDAEVEVVSNDNAQLIYKCPKTFQEVYLEEFGDTESVSMDLLQTMKSKARDFFEKYWIILEDVYVPDLDKDVEITIEDVYDYLGLSKIYNRIENLDSDYLDNVLIKYKFDKFKESIDKMDKKLLSQLISRSVALYKDGEFTDSSKQTILESITDNEYLFKENDLKTKK